MSPSRCGTHHKYEPHQVQCLDGSVHLVCVCLTTLNLQSIACSVKSIHTLATSIQFALSPSLQLYFVHLPVRCNDPVHLFFVSAARQFDRTHAVYNLEGITAQHPMSWMMQGTVSEP